MIVVNIDHYRYCTVMFLFFIKVDDLEIPEFDTASDEVNMEAFWRQVDHSMVARGLIRGNLRCGEFTSYSGPLIPPPNFLLFFTVRPLK